MLFGKNSTNPLSDTPMTKGKITALDGGILILLAFIWGSSFILIKFTLEHFTPQQVGSLRIFISFLVLLPGWLFAKARTFTRKQIIALMLVAMFSSGIPPFLFAFAQTKIDSSLAAILNSLVPLFTLLIGLVFFGRKATWLKVLGVLMGLVGAITLILFQAGDDMYKNVGFALLVVIAALFYAAGSNVLKERLSNISPITITTVTFTLLGPVGIYLVWHYDVATTLQQSPDAWQAIGYILILSIFGTAIALVLFNYLIQRTTALFGTSVTYLIPVVAIFWGVLDGEVIGWIQAIGLLVILLGIYLSSK